MKLTKQQLKQIIKEELEADLSEGGLDMSKLHKPTSLPGKTKKSRPTDDSKKDLDMSKLHKPTSLPGKSEEDDSEDLQEKTFAPAPPTKDYKGNVKAAQRRAADSVKMQDLKSRSSFADPTGKADRRRSWAAPGLSAVNQAGVGADVIEPIAKWTGKLGDDAGEVLVRSAGDVARGAKGLSKYLPFVDKGAAALDVGTILKDPSTSKGRKAAELASVAAGLNPVVGVGQAAYDITQGITGQEGSPLDIDLKTAGSDAWGALTGRDPEDAHTGGTQVDLSTRTDASCKRRGPKGKCLDAPSSTTPKVTPPPTTPKPSDLVAKRDDDEDDIPKPGKNLAEAWGFSMDLDKLNESTSGHVTPAKD